MRLTVLGLGAAAAIFAVAGPAAASVVPMSGDVLSLPFSPGAKETGRQLDEWEVDEHGRGVRPVTAINAADNLKSTAFKITNEVNASAAWDPTAASGTFGATVERDLTLLPGITANQKKQTVQTSAGWDYEFSVDQATTLNIAFDFLETGDLTGFSDWSLTAQNMDNGLAVADDTLTGVIGADGHIRGSASVTFGPGLYTVGLASVGENTLKKDISGGYADSFTWTLSQGDVAAVPEPAAWTMMIFGFGLIGATMRKRPRHGPARA